MDQTQADQAATASKVASNEPLFINDNQRTEGDLVIDTLTDQAIKITFCSRWKHYGDVDATGGYYGLSIEARGVASINGNITTYTKKWKGIQLGDHAQLTITGDLDSKAGDGDHCNGLGVLAGPGSEILVKGKTTLFGKYQNGLLLQSGAKWTSEDELTAAGPTAIAIDQATFDHRNDLTLRGTGFGLTMKGGSATINGSVITVKGENTYGIFLENTAKLTLNGDLDVKGGKSGIKIGNISKISIKSPQKIAIAGKENGLSVGDLCRFSSEGTMTLHSFEQGTALLIKGAEDFNHQGTLFAEGAFSALVIMDTPVTIIGHTTANGKEGDSLYLSQCSHLTLNGTLEAKAGRLGIEISDHSQLMVTEAATICAGHQAGIKLSDQSCATFKGAIDIHSKRSNGIDLASGSVWDSSSPLAIMTPNSAVLTMGTQASFKHQGPLTAQGKHGLQLASGAVATIQEAVSDITSHEDAVQIEGATFTHQGQLQLTSQGRGIVLSKEGCATIEGRLEITTQMQPAVVLSGGATLELKQSTTTLYCQKATSAAVQLESGSHWISWGVLAINTTGELAIQLNAAHFNHQGLLTLSEGQALTIQGNSQTKGVRNVLAITQASSANIKVDHPLTLNNILLANSGATVILDSPQLSVNGVIDLTKCAGGSLTFNGSGTLQLDTLHCSPGSRLTINGDYRVSIGTVIFDLDNVTSAPAQLAFHLSPKNQLKIGQFVLTKSTTAPAPIIEITGSDLMIDFDLKNVDVSAFPAGRHSDYQTDEQSPPIRLISDASGNLRTPSSAQITPSQATDEWPVTATIHPLTQALAAEESSEVPGLRQRQLYYYSAVGQAAPIALLTNASSLLIPTSSQLSSSPPAG